jgi:hypothetical protein
VNNRDRFLKTMRFESVDHPPLPHAGTPWPATRKRWEREGLPVGADLSDYFGLEPMPREHVAMETLLFPPFEEVILEETADRVIKIDKHGVKVRNLKDETSMPEHLDYPIKDRASLSWLREKLNWDTPGRVRGDWLERANEARRNGTLVFSNGGMYFAFLNEHMGTERLMMAYFEDPDFVHAVNDLLCTLCENVLKTVLPAFTPDMIGYHEDMAYKTASLISPDMFKEFMLPYYRRIQALAEPAGIDVQFMDSDGNIHELIPLWLDCGINVMTPCEVAAGMDVVALRKEYGKTLGMIGGFDKRILADSPGAIRTELERLRPVIEGGGYIPQCDHGVPYDVSFGNYRALIDGLKTLYGMD